MQDSRQNKTTDSSDKTVWRYYKNNIFTDFFYPKLGNFNRTKMLRKRKQFLPSIDIGRGATTEQFKIFWREKQNSHEKYHQ